MAIEAGGGAGAVGRGGDGPCAPPPVTPEQAALIRFQHHRRGTSVKMLAAIMQLPQAAVRAVLAEPVHCPGHPNGSVGEPSDPTEPERPPRAAGTLPTVPAVEKAKVPVPTFYATASGYVPIMSDAYRRRAAR